MNIKSEKRYEKVFGETFAMYTKQEMIDFIEPFKIRFERNNIDPKSIFSGKKCFDAGCGNGRGALFMLMNGATHVTCYDFSDKNIESTKRLISEFGFHDKITTKQGSLASIPFKDSCFDFVWCNGVIMHTEKPNKCLSEITRILKLHGKSWIYIYGAGGIYWKIIYNLRQMFSDISVQDCINVLKLLRYSTRYIAEFIDDWFATYLRTYTQKDFIDKLVDLGFESPSCLKYGTDYDTSHRLNIAYSSSENELMGEGDLRFLGRKSKSKQQNQFFISECEKGSEYSWPNTLTSELDPLFRNLNNICMNNKWIRIAAAAHIQRELRLEMSEMNSLDFQKIISIVKDVSELSRKTLIL